MKNLLYIILAMTIVSCIGGAMNNDEDASKQDSDSVTTIVKDIVDTVPIADSALINLSPQQVDSIVFRLTHHYSNNFNFIVKADSLTLIPREGDIIQDTCRIYCGDLIAVAAIKATPGDSIDSIWVKVAHDQTTMGWIPERQLLKGATPDDPVSQMLDVLSSSRAIWMSAFVVLGIIAFFLRKGKNVAMPIIFRLEEMTSPYPLFFLTLVALMASLYASVQKFVPEFWQEYYYHPTLNPLILPPVMAVLVVLAWLVVITFIAVIDEVYHHFYLAQGVTYMLELSSLGMIIYLLISWTTFIYIGYVLLIALLYFAGYAYVKHIAPRQ